MPRPRSSGTSHWRQRLSRRWKRLWRQETITLHWSMDDAAWTHWARGRAKHQQTIEDVVLEGLDRVRKGTDEAVQKIVELCEMCDQKSTNQGTESPPQEAKESRHKIEIQLLADIWNEAYWRIVSITGPVRLGQLLAAVILDSESWREEEYDAGWNEDSMVASFTSLTTYTTGFSLGRRERFIAWVLTGAAVASAVAAWLALCR